MMLPPDCSLRGDVGRRRCRRTACSASDELLDDALRVAPDATDEHGGEGVLERQADEEQTVLADTPRCCSGQPSSPSIGSEIHVVSLRKPVHHTTFATSSTSPSASSGRPSTTPTVFGLVVADARGVEVSALHAEQRPTGASDVSARMPRPVASSVR